MTNLIFLDIDGVLNSHRTGMAFGGYGTGLDPEWDPVAVKMLRNLTEAADAQIVVSSSWRHDKTVEDFHEMFAGYRWDTYDIIIGMTPSLQNVPRGLEIYTWFENNPQYATSNYVIFDDRADMLEEQLAFHFVKTDIAWGLGYGDIQKAAEILGCKLLPDPVINNVVQC